MSVLPRNPATASLVLGARSGGLGGGVPETLRARGRRVLILLVAIVLMSIGDLYMTLTHLTHTGMLEANPIARQIMAYNSPALLSAWKLASVGLAVSILYWVRHRGKTEIATWFCFLVLTWLTCRWFVYNDQVGMFTEFPIAAAAGYPHAEWVAMTPDD
jgi:hypothetical protein